MSVCTQCGHQLGVGRFCVNCGHPVDAAPAQDAPPTDDWRTGTAERPAVPAVTKVTEPRYPLYADETPATRTGTHRRVDPRPTRGVAWLPWLAAALVLTLVAGTGAWLLLADGDDDPATTATEPRAGSRTTEQAEPSPSPSREPSDKPSDKPTKEPAADPEEVARKATVTVPAVAPPNQDLDGNLVRYEGRNMLDGVSQTTWRMPGDGSGESLVLELTEPTTLTSVGLVNGYAKTALNGATSYDWYTGNRRVLAVEWVFDDGTVVGQDLESTRELQSVDIDPVTTRTVQLRLVTVSAPGEGSSARNYTAISEVSLLGVSA